MALPNTPQVPFIVKEFVQQILDVSQLLSVVERGLAQYSMGRAGGVVQPVRSVVPVDKYNG